MTIDTKWSTEQARQWAAQGNLAQYVHDYLNTGPWRNLGLSQGLKKEPRIWQGPLLIDLNDVVTTCGPEADKEYQIPLESWEFKVQEIATTLIDPLKLPPLILQNIKNILYVRDGNHRVGAARLKGWTSLWAIIWMDQQGNKGLS